MLFEYVYSAPTYLRLSQRSSFDDNDSKNWFGIIKEGIKRIQDKVATPGDKNPILMSILFNAYTEDYLGPWLLKNDMFGFKSLYADSGGLQVVSMGKVIDEKIKEKMYGNQIMADYGFCFDEIPVRNSLPVWNTNSRSATNIKIYFPKQAEACARKTAQNVKEQIEIFDKLRAKTKILYIIQGNNHKDMVEWFRIADQEFDQEHWNYIGGLAFAGACIGTNAQSSIETAVAYHIIRERFSIEKVKNHLHLLGYGAMKRMLPILFLIRSGFIPDEVKLSLDSTTFSMSYVMGKFFRLTDGIRLDAKTQHAEIKKMHTMIYDMFSDILLNYYPNLNRNDVLKHIIQHNKSISNTITFSPKDRVVSHWALVALTCLAQIIGFKYQIDAALNDDYSITKKNHTHEMAILGLQEVRDMDDFIKWEKTNHTWMNDDLSRVMRQSSNSLDSFFQD